MNFPEQQTPANTTFVVLSVCLALFCAAPAQAESPVCTWELSDKDTSIVGLEGDCLEVSISACYNALEGSVENNCQGTLTLLGWPNTDGQDINVASGSSQIFNILGGEGPAGPFEDTYNVRLGNTEGSHH